MKNSDKVRKFQVRLLKNAYNAASAADQAKAFAQEVDSHVASFDPSLKQAFVTTEITSKDGGAREIAVICSPAVIKELQKAIPSIQSVTVKP